jgi:DNA polymerase I-like protein with 3'-5' exonuclease and polymerase domains
MKGFKGIKEYQDKQRDFIKTHNYILLNDLVPYKSYIPNYNRLQSIKEEFNSDFWTYYKIIKAKKLNNEFITDKDDRMLEKVKYYFKKKSDLEKHAINFKCQGSGAIMLKIACILFWKYLIKNNLLNKVKILILAHDKQFVVYKLC